MIIKVKVGSVNPCNITALRKLLKWHKPENLFCEKNSKKSTLFNFYHQIAFEDYSIHIFLRQPVHLPLKRAYFEQDRKRGWFGALKFVQRESRKSNPLQGHKKNLAPSGEIVMADIPGAQSNRKSTHKLNLGQKSPPLIRWQNKRSLNQLLIKETA